MKKDIQNFNQYLQDNDIDAYIVFTNDDHGSEYVIDYYKTRAYLSGFTGSAGTLLITKTQSFLWTDGRYFIQAAEQLKESGTILMKSGEKGVPDIFTFIKSNQIERVAFDFKTATVDFVKWLKQKVKGIELIDDADIIDRIWENRPKKISTRAYILSDDVAGASIQEKIQYSRLALADESCDNMLISSLDDIAWLFNMRGNDIMFNPVNYAYAVLTYETVSLFIDSQKLDEKTRNILKENAIDIYSYDEIYDFVGSLQGTTLIDQDKTNYALYSRIKTAKVADPFPTTRMKAIKTAVEIENMKKAHIEDGVAMVKFMHYLKEHLEEGEDEITLADRLENYRRESRNFLDLSFDTICGYEENGAIVHYSATKESAKKVAKRGLLLVDSGAQYRYGTTDITRTFALGPVTDEEKKAFTIVLKSHIALATAVFPDGTVGSRLDAICRAPMYKEGMDFKHGTGHGVGYLLNVHEGPQNISPRAVAPKFALTSGMITSNEPGYYKENAFGIRHENLVLCVDYDRTDSGDFCAFETITMVPFDLDAVDATLLTKEEKSWLNTYHKTVYNTLKPYLKGEDLAYLKKSTRKI